MHSFPAPAAPFSREQFVAQVVAGLPLADAVLSLGSYLFQPDLLGPVFAEHRGRSYEDTLSFSGFVQLIADSLLHHGGSARRCLERADAAGTLPVSPEAFYGKLRRMPLDLSQGFLADLSLHLQELLPPRPAALPESLQGLNVLVVDGKKLKRVAKRLLPARGAAGKLFGGKLLVAWQPRSGLVLALAADPDGEANDCRLVPALLPQVRDRAGGPRLWVADRQFCDLVQARRFTQDGDHVLVRYHPKVHFHPDPQRPARTSQDASGRTVVEKWGWLGGQRDVYVRRITLHRPQEEDVVLVTDLVDEVAIPAADLLAVYLRRWGIERVFQQVTEVFHLQRLIGSTPQATVFQGAFCLVLYNVIEVIKSYIAAAQQRDPETISSESLFYDVRRQLTAVTELATPPEVVACVPKARSHAEITAYLGSLLSQVWMARWTKAVNKRPRPHAAKAKGSGAHTSVHRLLEKHRQNKEGKP